MYAATTGRRRRRPPPRRTRRCCACVGWTQPRRVRRAGRSRLGVSLVRGKTCTCAFSTSVHRHPHTNGPARSLSLPARKPRVPGGTQPPGRPLPANVRTPASLLRRRRREVHEGRKQVLLRARRGLLLRLRRGTSKCVRVGGCGGGWLAAGNASQGAQAAARAPGPAARARALAPCSFITQSHKPQPPPSFANINADATANTATTSTAIATRTHNHTTHTITHPTNTRARPFPRPPRGATRAA